MKKKSKKSGTRISDEEFDLALDKALNAKRSESKSESTLSSISISTTP